jgi:phosphatidate phosphatase PAH1
MKRLGIFLTLMVTPFILFSQSKAVTDFQNKYKGDRDAAYVEISGSLFKFISMMNDNEGDEVDPDIEAIANIAEGMLSMRVLKISKYESGLEQSEIDALKTQLKKDSYESLMTFREGKKYIDVMVQGSGDAFKNPLILVDEKDEFVLFNIEGTFTPQDIAHLARNREHWH